MRRLTELLRRHYSVFSLLLIAVGAAMYIVFSMDPLVWADEAYTFATIRHSVPEIWAITAADVHPPLYYLLLKLLSAPFGYCLFACRLLSAVPCLVILAVAAVQFPRLFGKRTAVIFLIACLFYPFTMNYSAEVRMYSLAELFVFLNALYAYRCWKWNRGRDWAVFALSGVCAALTHYFALVSAGVVYLLLLICAVKDKRLRKGWLLASAATVVAYLPWLWNLLSQLVYKVSNEYWIEPITLSTIVGYGKTLFGCNGIVLFPLFSAAAFLIAFASMLTARDRSAVLLCVCALAVPLGTAFIGLAASFLVRPVFVVRYLLPSAPLAVFCFAFCLSRMEDRQLFAGLLTVCLMGGVSNGAYTAKHALIPSSDRISDGLVSTFPRCDAYVVLSGNTMHTSQELSYYDCATPIFTPDQLGADNPYPNRFPLDQFRADEYPRILLVTEAGAGVPVSMPYKEVSFLASVSVSGTWQDIWFLSAGG